MNLFKYTLLLLLAIPVMLCAKNKEHVLNGKVKVKGGDSYPYQLVFEVSHNSVKGYSVTKLPDGTDNRASITGMMNKKKKVLIISENKLLSAPQKDVATCFINAFLTYKTKGSNYIISGVFAGKDNEQHECGSGSVEFTQPIAQDDLYADDTIVVKPPIVPTESRETVAGKDEITAGIGKQYDWHTDSCTIDIWDGGVIDGDVITLLVNDAPVLTRYTLTKEKKSLKFPVTKKVNTITIVADDEGLNPPNTAQLIFYDGSEQYRLTAFNKKGAKATVVIRKK